MDITTPATTPSPATTTTDPAHRDPELLIARAALSRIAARHTRSARLAALGRLIARDGAIAAAHRLAGDGELDRAAADLAAAEDTGIALLTPEDPQWPRHALTDLNGSAPPCLPASGEPVALWVRGRTDLAALTARGVTITGARAASTYGSHIAADLAGQLAQAGAVIVTGAAFGIDAAALSGAAAASGPVLVLGASGPDQPHPARLRERYDRAAEHGALITAYPPGAIASRSRFHTRARLLAALGTRGTVIVEVSGRGSALTTARTGAALGRYVLAVPGSVASATSTGCHQLVRAGTAALFTTVDDLLTDLALTPTC